MKHFTKSLIFFTLFLIFSSFDLSASGVNMCLDFARFRYDKDNTYIEIYYLVDQSDTLIESKNAYLELQILKSASDSILARKQVDIDFTNSGSASARLGLVKTVLPEGEYKLKLLRYGDETKAEIADSQLTDFSVASFNEERITLSDLELCSNIIPKSNKKDALFYKNTMEVYPNPACVYNEQHPRLYYYIELYNVNKQNPADYIYIQTAIMDKGGQIRSQKRYKRPRKYESLVEKGAFNISKLETGMYALIFAVSDTISGYAVTRRMNFYVDNPGVVLVQEEENEEQLFLHSRYFMMTNDMLDESFAQARYIATPEEIKIYQSLVEPESKKRFLFKFWREREKENPGIEFDYYQRVEYANEHFRYSGEPGWKTDRGRIYVTYGAPDQIEKAGASDLSLGNDMTLQTPSGLIEGSGQVPHYVWYYYNLEGGVKFYFVDHSGVGNFRLVHSTYSHEVHNPNWQTELFK